MVGTIATPVTVRALPALLERMRAALVARREVLDDLNVFPVPDGDTGTNMVATVTAAVDALPPPAHAHDAPADEVVRAIVRGAVHGARGNSGVILSQVLRAVVESVADGGALDADRYAHALGRARDLGYDAVAAPVEGTILTVIAAAAHAATRAAARRGDLVATSAAACDAAGAAVARTRDQLEALRVAGVVDAGARGFELVLAALHGHLTGEDPPVVLDPPRAAEPPELPADHGHDAGATGAHTHGEAPSMPPVEVQYLLAAPDGVAGELRHTLDGLGDSVVVVAAGGLLNVHVHTTRIGSAIEAGLALGQVSRIEVNPLAPPAPDHPPAAPTTPRSVGAVAVVNGAGLSALARTLGAVIVEGTAGALPSVADLLQGIGTVDAERVLVLPGHPAAVAAASTAAGLAALEAGRSLDVIEAASTPPAVLAGLAVLDPDAPAADVVASVRMAAAGVRSGEVVAAVRDARTPIGPITAGQPLAVVDGEVIAAHDDPLAALGELARRLGVGDAELVTLLVGADADDAQRADAEQLLTGLTAAEVEVVDAGHRPAIFWIGVE